MKFEEIKEHFLNGNCVKRKAWKQESYLYFENNKVYGVCLLNIDKGDIIFDILFCNDWEILDE